MIDRDTAEALAWLLSGGGTRDRDGARSAGTACPARVPKDRHARAARHRPSPVASPVKISPTDQEKE